MKFEIGDHVVYIDRDCKQHHALVTRVFDHKEGGATRVNVTYVSTDPQRHDIHGRQLERDAVAIPERSETYPTSCFFVPPE